MKKHLVLIAAASLAAGTVLAQQSSRDGIAQLKAVKGNVLLSRDAGLVAGSEAARLTQGTRVITTANSEVVVVFDKGCEVRLKENQRFEVDSGKPCAALIASVESILAQPAGLAAAGGLSAAGFWSLVPPAAGALIGAEILKPGPATPTPLSPS
jgi:hypothetical protein